VLCGFSLISVLIKKRRGEEERVRIKNNQHKRKKRREKIKREGERRRREEEEALLLCYSFRLGFFLVVFDHFEMVSLRVSFHRQEKPFRFALFN